jgi:hypothetical protein
MACTRCVIGEKIKELSQKTIISGKDQAVSLELAQLTYHNGFPLSSFSVILLSV